MRAVVRERPWYHLTDFDGVDAFDVLLNPIYMSVLNTARRGTAAQASTSNTLFGRLRGLGYRGKMVGWEHALRRKSAPIQQADIVLWSRDITHSVTMCPVAT